MAKPNLIKGSYLDIMVGDGAAPEVFTILCGLTTRSFTETVNTSDDYVRDCDDPEDIPVRVLDVTGHLWSISGEGLYNRGQAGLLRGLIGQSKNYRFAINEPNTDNIDSGYYEGPAMITTRTITGGDGGKVTGPLTIESDGEWDWVAT